MNHPQMTEVEWERLSTADQVAVIRAAIICKRLELEQCEADLADLERSMT